MTNLYTVYDHYNHEIVIQDATLKETSKCINIPASVIAHAAHHDIRLYERYDLCVESFPDDDIREVKRDRDAYLRKVRKLNFNWNTHVYRGVLA